MHLWHLTPDAPRTPHRVSPGDWVAFGRREPRVYRPALRSRRRRADRGEPAPLPADVPHDDGRRFVEILVEIGIVPGIKVDSGAGPLARAPGERITAGLDGLRERLEEYLTLGARFAKWRAVIGIGDGQPSDYCLDTNAHALARYAALCQEAGLVPIVKPEVLLDGSHSLERGFAVTEATLERDERDAGRGGSAILNRSGSWLGGLHGRSFVPRFRSPSYVPSSPS
jgi:hypothetical protein